MENKIVYVVHGADTDDWSWRIVGVYSDEEKAREYYKLYIARDVILSWLLELDIEDEWVEEEVANKYVWYDSDLMWLDYADWYTTIDTWYGRTISYWISREEIIF